jgi:hypothetical protein
MLNYCFSFIVFKKALISLIFLFLFSIFTTSSAHRILPHDDEQSTDLINEQMLCDFTDNVGACLSASTEIVPSFLLNLTFTSPTPTHHQLIPIDQVELESELSDVISGAAVRLMSVHRHQLPSEAINKSPENHEQIALISHNDVTIEISITAPISQHYELSNALNNAVNQGRFDNFVWENPQPVIESSTFDPLSQKVDQDTEVELVMMLTFGVGVMTVLLLVTTLSLCYGRGSSV